jgi:hypothetical protein
MDACLRPTVGVLVIGGERPDTGWKFTQYFYRYILEAEQFLTMNRFRPLLPSPSPNTWLALTPANCAVLPKYLTLNS